VFCVPNYHSCSMMDKKVGVVYDTKAFPENPCPFFPNSFTKEGAFDDGDRSIV